MTALPVATAAIDPGQFVAYARFELLRTIRNRRYLLTTIAMPVLFYALYTGALQGGNGRSSGTVDGVAWPTFFMVSMAAYGSMAAALSMSRPTATERSAGWTRQLRAVPLDPVIYAVAKLAVSFVATLPSLAAVMAVGIVFDHVSLAPTTWLEVFVLLALGTLPFVALGLLIGYLFDGDSVQGAFTITMFALAILGGLWAPIQAFPPVLATIGRMLPSYHFADLGWQALAGSTPQLADVAILAGYTLVFGLLVAWRYRAEEQHARV